MTITVTHSTVADASFSATGAAAWDATHSFTGILDVANGGTGTATPALVAGTNVTITGAWPNQTIAASGGGGGSGTVTSVSVVSANGFAGTVATDTTTPAITLSTSITGVLKGNGTAISAASAGTDYQAPITLTTTGTSGAATFVANTLNIPQYSGGGGSGTVTSVDATVPAFLSVTGGPITTSGTLAISYSGTALPIANGGTGQTTRQAAINALVDDLRNTRFLRANGTNATMSTIQVTDVPTLNQDTTGTAANVTGTVAIANGGTGQTTASAGFNALSPVTTTGDLILGNGANSATRLPIGTDGQILTSNGSTAAWGSKLTNGTAVTLTNQTTVDFTSLPSWVKRITVMLDGVSLSGTDTPLIQLGYGGTPTYVTSGYSGGTQNLTTAPASGASQPGNGFPIRNALAANANVGILTIVLLSASTNTWLATYSGYGSTISIVFSNGSVALSGALTAVRLTRSGTNTFDAGVINILYE
jgi:hypothetical protein